MCIPGLHLSLGIFNRLWTLLEAACQELDFKIALENASSGSTGDTNAISVSMVRKLTLMKFERDTLQKMADVTSEMFTYSSLIAEDPSTDSACQSLSKDVSTAMKTVANKVYHI